MQHFSHRAVAKLPYLVPRAIREPLLLSPEVPLITLHPLSPCTVCSPRTSEQNPVPGRNPAGGSSHAPPFRCRRNESHHLFYSSCEDVLAALVAPSRRPAEGSGWGSSITASREQPPAPTQQRLWRLQTQSHGGTSTPTSAHAAASASGCCGSSHVIADAPWG